MAEKKTLIPMVQQIYGQELLMTKLDIPRLHKGMVNRERLMMQLDGMVRPGVTLVNAPAGYGKTLSIAGWLNSRNIRSAWLTLDLADNDPYCFWQYMLSAFTKSVPELNRKLRLQLSKTENLNLNTFIVPFINDLSHHAPAITVVLDDIQVILEPLIQEDIRFLLECLSELNMRVILIGRHIPAELIQSERIKGCLHAIGAETLRFDRDEIRELLGNHNLDAKPHEVRIVETKTEGWAMGLMLGLRTMNQQRRKLGFMEAFHGNNQLLAGYLSDEIFSQWDPHIRDFLLKTSVLDRMTVPLCNAVTGRKDSHKILKELSKDNTLVVTLNYRKGWYRYHNLLSTFLRTRLSDEQKDQIRDLNRAAAEYYERNHIMDAAITHYLKGRHYVKAVELIEKTAPQMIREGRRLVTLKRWLQRIPDETVTGNALLLIIEGWIHLLEDRKEEAEHAVLKAEKLKKLGSFEGELHSLKANLALKKGNFEQTAALIEKAVEQPNFNNVFKGAAKSLSESETGLCLLAGRLGFYGNINLLRINRGWLPERLNQCGYETGGGLDIIQAEVHYELNELDLSVPLLMKGLSDASAENLWSVKMPAMVLLAKVMRAKGDHEGAINQTRLTTDQLKKAGQIQRHRTVQAFLTRIELEAGNWETADLWLKKDSPDISQMTTDQNVTEKMIKAIILMHQKKHDLASLELLSVKVFMEKENRLIGLVETLNLLAICSHENGNEETALNYAHQSVVIGSKQGYIRTYVDEGTRLLPVLKHLQRVMKSNREECSALCEYTASLVLEIRKHIKNLPQRKPQMANRQQEELIEPLTSREMMVLRCLSKEMSNQEISEHLHISISTVKVHTRNIYGKLAVCNRIQAVTTARELKLV